MAGMSAASVATVVATQTRYSAASTGTATSTLVAAPGSPSDSTSRYSWCAYTHVREDEAVGVHAGREMRQESWRKTNTLAGLETADAVVDDTGLEGGGGAEPRAPEAELPVERGVGAGLDDKDVLAVVVGGEVPGEARAVRGDERRGAAARGVVGVRGRAAKDVERRRHRAVGRHGPLHRAPLRKEERPPVPVAAREVQVPRRRRVCLCHSIPNPIPHTQSE